MVSHVYGCFLDASKAFDHALLFEKLLKKNLPPAVARLLLPWYSSQQFKVRWSNSFSEPFHTSNGERQGGVVTFCFIMVTSLVSITVESVLDQVESFGNEL